MEFQKWYVYLIDSIISMVIVLVLGRLALLHVSRRNPSRMQSAFELAMDGLRNLFVSSMGPGSERHLWLVIPLFFYIWISNILGQIPIPGLYSPTGELSNTFALALIVFIYVQYIGIKSKGIGGYFKHFLGPLPVLAIFFLVIEIIGEVAKPFSLSMRLFGNISAEDIINNLAVGAGKSWFLPFQVPVYFLQIFTDTIQAFIFPLLACAYIGVMSAHHEEHGDEAEHAPHHDSRQEDLVDSAAGLGGRISTAHPVDRTAGNHVKVKV